jgi:hypothetical protein
MYLDPGFGGMLVQAIVAIAAVGGGLLFSFRKKIRKLFIKDKINPQPMNVPDTPDDVVDVLNNEIK